MSFQLKSTFPALAEELETKLINKGQHTYAAQIAELIVTDRCHCGDEMCAQMVCGVDLTDVPLEEEDQVEVLLVESFVLVVLAFKGKIANIELLYRDEIRAVLDELIPVRPEQRDSDTDSETSEDSSNADRS